MESPLTSQRAVIIASRVVCILFLAYAALTLAELPGLVIGLAHYRVSTDAAGTAYYSYWTRRYALWITSALVRGAVELWLAGVFYRTGPRISRFLLGGDKVQESRAEGVEGTA